MYLLLAPASARRCFHCLQKAAQSIKDGLDKKLGPTWHCVVGEGFGFNITYNTRNMLYLYYGEKLGILVFKC